MLGWMRVGALVAAGATAVLLVIGDHPPEFVVADSLLVVALVVAAALPAERALPWLMAGFAFAAGVFTVAFAASVADSALNAQVGLAAVACVVAVASGAVTLRRT